MGMKVLKIVTGVFGVLAIATALTFVGAKFSDGPIGIFPGGALRSGDIVPYYIIRWGIARNVETIEMQLADEDTSRTTWIVEHEAHAYIPASLGFPPGKTWHQRADGARAWLRIEGKRYEVRLDRFEDPTILPSLAEQVARKYGGGPPSDAGVWWFEVTSLAPIPDF